MKKIFLGDKWFFEDFLEGESQDSTWGFKIEKEIFSGKSEFQRIEIFETKKYGRVLVLDGFIQLSINDEFVYHEMLVHPAVSYSKKKEKILIIGGGDGGVLREIVKYKDVKEIFLVDIDKEVINLSKKYLGSVSNGAFKDRRLKVFNRDALGFVDNYKNYFDIIFSDLTDPSGPSAALWENKFYGNIRDALKKNGIASFQSEYLKDNFAKKIRQDLKQSFPFLRTHKAFVGCFPLGEFTFSLGSKNINFDVVSQKNISQKFKEEEIKTKYYFPELHFFSRILTP